MIDELRRELQKIQNWVEHLRSDDKWIKVSDDPREDLVNVF